MGIVEESEKRIWQAHRSQDKGNLAQEFVGAEVTKAAVETRPVFESYHGDDSRFAYGGAVALKDVHSLDPGFWCVESIHRIDTTQTGMLTGKRKMMLREC